MHDTPTMKPRHVDRGFALLTQAERDRAEADGYRRGFAGGFTAGEQCERQRALARLHRARERALGTGVLIGVFLGGVVTATLVGWFTP